MEINIEDLDPKQLYKLLTGLVIPRPIAFVTSVNNQGRLNAAPFSYFNIFPPYIFFAPMNNGEEPKDTAKNIIETGSFVVNLVDEAIAEEMNKTAVSLPYGENELEHTSLTTTPSVHAKAPRITESPVSFECDSHQVLTIGNYKPIIGIVRVAHVRDDIFDKEQFYVVKENYHPVGRMHGAGFYARTNDLFELVRPDKK